MTLSPRERDIDAAVRLALSKRLIDVLSSDNDLQRFHVAGCSACARHAGQVRNEFSRIQATRLAASTLSHCGHTKRKAKTDRVHDALRAVVG